MLKRILILLTLLLFGTAFPVLGQTVVNLTVTDTPDNQLWNNGTWSVKLQPPAGNLSQTNTFTLLSGGGSLAAQSGTLSSTATAAITLPANANIGPNGTVWQFTVCPQASAGCFQQSITVSTSSPQTLAINPPSIRINLSTATPPISAYATGEISGAVIGSQFYLLGTGIQVCSVISGNTCTTWVASGGGISSNSPVPANQAQGPRYNVKNYGAVGDAKSTNTCNITLNSGVVTDTTSSPFLPSDVGKKFYQLAPGFGVGNFSPVTQTIVSYQSASQVTVGTNSSATSSNQNCVWFTQKETTAFRAAGNAAIQTLATAPNVGNLSPTLAYDGNVYCPEGGYVLDSTMVDQVNATTLQGISFQGAGRFKCQIYISPDAVLTHNAFIMRYASAYGMEIGGFSVQCFNFNFNLAGAEIYIQNANNVHMYDIELDGCGNQGDNTGKFGFNSLNNSVLDNLRVNSGAQTSDTEPGMQCQSCSGVKINSFNSTNPGPAGCAVFTGAGSRGQTGPMTTWVQGTCDEGGTTGEIFVSGGTQMSMFGITCFDGSTTCIVLDGTSTLYLHDSNIAPFGGSCGGGTRNAITEVAGSVVYSSGNTIQGCGATGAITGPSTAKFVDQGGNDIHNCPAGCPLVTATDFATHGFTGGIVPTTSVQMPSNTVFAVNGNLLATAQNLAQILLPVNQQLISLTAQSGGTTPANSSCATPPVITLSDGTRSATMTMTTGKTFWRSDVDAVTNINQVFASGAVLTVSIGANTCATPPANVSVTYNVQSVLNP